MPHFQGADVHHHDRVHEYVTREQAAINAKIVAKNPSVREHNRQDRQRDAHRVDKNKVRNPLFTSTAVCLVFKYVHGRRRDTLYDVKYASEDVRYAPEYAFQNFFDMFHNNVFFVSITK